MKYRTTVCRVCRGTGQVAATPGQPGDGLAPCPRCERDPRDELRMTQAELDESVAAFCDEAEDAYVEAREALLDSPDINSGATETR